MEIIYSELQTVQPNANVLFNDTVIGCSNCLMHREGSGLVTLRGSSSQSRARYRVTFTGNIGTPEGGTAGAVQLALSINGEGLASTTMISTSAAAGDLDSVSRVTTIDVPRGCCFEVAVRNTGEDPVAVSGADLIVERTA